MAGGEGSCCARRARAGAPGRCHRPVTGGVCLPHGCFPGGKTAAAWTRPAPGGPAGPGSSAQCGLPARTRGAPPPCCALGPEGGGGLGAWDGRQRRGAPGSPLAWVYPRTREIATRPDARVAPSPGVPFPAGPLPCAESGCLGMSPSSAHGQGQRTLWGALVSPTLRSFSATLLGWCE